MEHSQSTSDQLEYWHHYPTSGQERGKGKPSITRKGDDVNIVSVKIRRGAHGIPLVKVMRIRTSASKGSVAVHQEINWKRSQWGIFRALGIARNTIREEWEWGK